MLIILKSNKSSFIYTHIWVENTCNFRGFGAIKDTFLKKKKKVFKAFYKNN